MVPSGIKVFTRTVSLNAQHQIFHARISTGIPVRTESGFPACIASRFPDSIASRFPDSIASRFPAPSTTVSYHGSFLQIKSIFPCGTCKQPIYHVLSQKSYRSALPVSIGSKAGLKEYREQGRIKRISETGRPGRVLETARPGRVSETRQGKSTDSVVKKTKAQPPHTNNGAALSVLLQSGFFRDDRTHSQAWTMKWLVS